MFALLFFLSMYFVPVIVAFARDHHQKWAILALDTLLGWTMIGWILSLVWSLTKVDKGMITRRIEDTFR